MADDRLDREAQAAGGTGGAPPVLKASNRWITDGVPPDNSKIVIRDPRGRFRKGTVAHPAGRYQKGKSGNPKGRPKGRFRSGTRAAAALLDAQAEALMAKAIELALGGDRVTVRFCLGRVLGVRRGQPVELDMPAVAEPGDLAAAVTAIVAALADGRVTPDEALSLSQMLDGFPRVLAAGGADPTMGEGALEAAREEFTMRVERLRRGLERKGGGAAAVLPEL